MFTNPYGFQSLVNMVYKFLQSAKKNSRDQISVLILQMYLFLSDRELCNFTVDSTNLYLY